MADRSLSEIMNATAPAELIVIDGEEDRLNSFAGRLRKLGFPVVQCLSWSDAESLLSARLRAGLPLPRAAIVHVSFKYPELGNDPNMEGAEVVRELQNLCVRRGLPPIKTIGYTLEKTPSISILEGLSQMGDFGASEAIRGLEEPVDQILRLRILNTIHEPSVRQNDNWKRRKRDVRRHLLRRLRGFSRHQAANSRNGTAVREA